MSGSDMWIRIIDQQERNAQIRSMSAAISSEAAELHVRFDDLQARSERIRHDLAVKRAELLRLVLRLRYV